MFLDLNFYKKREIACLVGYFYFLQRQTKQGAKTTKKVFWDVEYHRQHINPSLSPNPPSSSYSHHPPQLSLLQKCNICVLFRTKLETLFIISALTENQNKMVTKVPKLLPFIIKTA
ncbi:hypothetical protein Pfo_031386 [Paulownia fortunei]|nr:hypothetical protein Pfo_031386 [Paulownia fortunei]